MILVTTHDNADFDSCGGVLAALLLHPGAVASFPGSKEPALRSYLQQEPGIVPELRAREVELGSVGTLVMVDTVSAERIGRFRELLDPPGRVRVICYDHHPHGHAPDGAEVWIRPVGAVSTLMLGLLRERGTSLTPAQATLLALGIYEDTGGLLHAGTTPEDLEAVAWLLGRGADLLRVALTLRRALTPEQVDLYHAMFHEARTYRPHGREVVVVSASMSRFVPDASAVAQQYVQATGVSRLAALLRMEDRIIVIVRSSAPDFDASRVAAAFAGGGHPYAASAVIHGKTLIEAQDALIRVIERVLAPEIRAADLATPVLYTVEAEATVSQAVDLLNRYRVNALPVMDQGRVTGALTRQVADVALHHGLSARRVKDLVVSDVDLVPPDADVEVLRQRLLSGNLRFILVGETPRRVMGIVTRTALLRRLHETATAARADLAASGQQGESLEGEDLAPAMDKRLPAPTMEVLRALGDLAASAGVEAYLVGGLVRDLLLGRDNRDLDVVVEGDACRLATSLAQRLGGRLRQHEAFQTAAVFVEDGPRVDLASARTEHYPHPAALPEVSPGGLRQDLFRRDFTINTFAVRLTPPGFGRLLDFFGSRKDLREGKIRVLHGLSFIEDPTRAFRAVRFSVDLDFEISRETAHLIRVALQENVFDRLSPVRLRREVERLLGGRKPATAVRLLEDFGLLRALHPGLKPTRRTYVRLERAEEVLSWHRLLYNDTDVMEWTVVLAVLAEHLDRTSLQELVGRLRPARAALRVLEGAQAEIHRLLTGLAPRRAPAPSDIHAMCRSTPTEVLLIAMASTGQEEIRRALAQYLSHLREVRLDIRGTDLLRAGVPEGPRVAQGLDAALKAKLDGEADRPEDQLAVALEAARNA